MISDRLTELRRGINTLSGHCVGIDSLDLAYEDLEKMEAVIYKLKSEINALVAVFEKAGDNA